MKTTEAINPDIVVYVCHNCIPEGHRLPRQWHQDGAHVRVTEAPCSGKMDAQYLFHAFEGGVRGLLVVTCPHGDCQLMQGNYRAEVRVNTVQRLLSEIGIEPERAELLHCGPEDSLKQMVHDAVKRFCDLEKRSLRKAV